MIDKPHTSVLTSQPNQSEKKADVPFGMEDPEFKELLGDMLKDDDQAKEAMKGIA